MANARFDPAKEGSLVAEINWRDATIKVALLRGYAFVAAHKFVADVTGAGGAIVATSGALAAKTFANGVADAADVTFTAVAAGAAITSMIVFQSSAVTGGADVAPAAQRLILYIDSYTNIPYTPNGSDINILWDNGANKIFAS